MAYTTITKVAAQVGGITIDGSSTPSTTDVDVWIAEAEDEINTRTGLNFNTFTVTNELYDWKNLDNILRLKSFPILSITTLEFNDQNAGVTPSYVTKTEDTDFYTYPSEAEVEFIPNTFNPKDGKRRFRLTYEAGFAAVPGTVERLATLITATRFVEASINNDGFQSKGGAVQIGTIKVDSPTTFSVSSYQSMKSEIETLYEKVIGDFKAFVITREYDL